jgi:hypothetical protein
MFPRNFIAIILQIAATRRSQPIRHRTVYPTSPSLPGSGTGIIKAVSNFRMNRSLFKLKMHVKPRASAIINFEGMLV